MSSAEAGPGGDEGGAEREVEGHQPCERPRSAGRRPTRREVVECQFASWYRHFRSCFPPTPPRVHSSSSSQRRRKHATIRSVIVPLSHDVVKSLLLSDGVHLPKGADVSSCASSAAANGRDDSDDEFDGATGETDEDEESDDDDDDDGEATDFAELNGAIGEAIRSLGGTVVPKLNWSAPRDATWINGGSLKCTTPGDVYVLLQSSDFIMHDVLHAFDGICREDDDDDDDDDNDDREEHGVDEEEGFSEEAQHPPPRDEIQFTLVLRKWSNLYTSMEFRCFVASRRIVAICQRDSTQCYPHLHNERDGLLVCISTFFDDVILPSPFPLSTYVFDCYVDRQAVVWLIDFNVWGERTDALLFSWNELESLRDTTDSLDDDEATGTDGRCSSGLTEEDPMTTATTIEISTRAPELRLVEREGEVRADPLASYRAPIDAVDLARGDAVPDNFEEEGVASFADFMSLCTRPSSLGDGDGKKDGSD